MEMCYDGALVMPSSYAVMNEEDMTYLHGGDTPEITWYGAYWHITNSQISTLTKMINVGAGSTAIAAVLVSEASTKIVGLLSAAIWTYGAGLDLMNDLGGNNGLNWRIFWNGTSVITPF